MKGQDGAIELDSRLRVHVLGERTSTLAVDVLRGLAARPKNLPPKHFYDDRGSELFERICETDEYYQTRTELELLERTAPLLMSELRPSDVIEIGSGGPRKARVLLRAAERCGVRARYAPFDVSEGALRKSAEALLQEFAWLEVHGTVGDYDHHLDAVPRGTRRLFAFLGGTIGNFEPDRATGFLSSIRRVMSPGDFLLLGTDLVKATDVLNRAYNDAQGFTDAFNKNVLAVINRELDGDFDLDAFRHVAFFDPTASQVEMHLESRFEQRVRIRALDMDVGFEAGERIRTEISRKFTRESVAALLESAGLALRSWHEAHAQGFGLSVSELL